jgi:tRNA threonylcarbamoyladenosine biosynthesis protein TsaB
MNPPRIVAIETSGPRGSLALGVGDACVGEAEFAARTEHARELFPSLDALCQRCGWPPGAPDECYVSIGPGSFTGLRVAVTVARHLALAGGTKVVAVPSMDVIAANVGGKDGGPERLVVFLHARAGEVFAAGYQRGDGAFRRVVEPTMGPPQRALADWSAPFGVVGEGAAMYRVLIESCGGAALDEALWWPRAVNVLRIGRRLALAGKYTPARALTPFYLRRPEAEEVWAKRAGGGCAED